MFRNLIPALTDEFHLVAPDYPGFGNSSAPPVEMFDYTFDKLAAVVEQFTEQVGLKKYALYVPVTMALRSAIEAERSGTRSVLTELVVQERRQCSTTRGLDNDFWKPLQDTGRTAHREERLSRCQEVPDPGSDTVAVHARGPQRGGDQPRHLDHRPGTPLDPARQPGGPVGRCSIATAATRRCSIPHGTTGWSVRTQPPTLIVWGKNDMIFPPAGAESVSKKDLKTMEFHLLDTWALLPWRKMATRSPILAATVLAEARRHEVSRRSLSPDDS